MGDRLATIDGAKNCGGCCTAFWGKLGPHLTQCGLGRGLPNGILIPPAVWPQ